MAGLRLARASRPEAAPAARRIGPGTRTRNGGRAPTAATAASIT